MYVPNYIPQPLEVPGNVSQDSWNGKLTFLRRVTGLHAISVIFIIALTRCPLPVVGFSDGLLGYVIALVILCAVRIATRGTRWDQRLSVALLPPVLVLFATLALAIERAGYPAWAPLAGLTAAAIYTPLCGRDFSFVGQYLLSLIVSEVFLAVLAPVLHQSPIQAAWCMGLNALYLTFYCYDLASLMSRRRFSEPLAAVVDLYRDVLNVFGWIVRCLKHWKRHRIWAGPWA